MTIKDVIDGAPRTRARNVNAWAAGRVHKIVQALSGSDAAVFNAVLPPGAIDNEMRRRALEIVGAVPGTGATTLAWLDTLLRGCLVAVPEPAKAAAWEKLPCAEATPMEEPVRRMNAQEHIQAAMDGEREDRRTMRRAYEIICRERARLEKEGFMVEFASRAILACAGILGNKTADIPQLRKI